MLGLVPYVLLNAGHQGPAYSLSCLESIAVTTGSK